MLKMLRAVFPGTIWLERLHILEMKFETNWFNLNQSWKDPKVRRKFLEDFEKEKEIKEPKNWGNITIKQVLCLCSG